MTTIDPHSEEPFHLLYTSSLPPYRYPCSLRSHLQVTTTCRSPGLISETFADIFHVIDTPYILTQLTDLVVNGTLLDVIDAAFSFSLMANNSVDSALINLTPTEQRLRRFKNSVPIPSFRERVTLLCADIERPKYTQIAVEFLKVYDLGTWLTILVIFLVHKLYVRLSQNNQQNHHSLVMWTGFFLMMMSTLYRNGLLTRLLVVHSESMISNLEDMVELIESRQVTLISRKSYSWYSVMQNSKRPILTRLRRALVNNPMVTLNTSQELRLYRQQIKRGTHVAITFEYDAMSVSSDWCNCQLIHLQEFGSVINGILFGQQVSDELIERINEVILSQNSYWLSIQRKYIRMYESQQMNCTGQRVTEKYTNVADYERALDLLRMSGVFAVLFLGLALAIIVFLYEWTKQLCSSKKNMKNKKTRSDKTVSDVKINDVLY